MAKTLLLKAKIREEIGTRSAKKVRQDGRIPATVYGHKEKPLAISLDARSTIEGLHHGYRVVDVDIEGKKITVMFKDLQYDYLGKDVIHIDLIRVDATETIKVTVAIELRGIAKGTHEGGIIEEHADRLQIECRANAIPESIVVSVKEVDVGDNIYAGDIELPSGIKLISSPETLLVTCSLVAAAKSTEELEEEAPVVPEVIGEKAEEGPESSSAQSE